jgi:hypothetical protein
LKAVSEICPVCGRDWKEHSVEQSAACAEKRERNAGLKRAVSRAVRWGVRRK